MNNTFSRCYHWLMSFVKFFQEIYKNPREMGTGFPSSIYLAKNIIKHVKHSNGLIVEFGPGTGVFTKMLIKAGFDLEKIYVIELSKSMAKNLQTRFPNLHIIHGDAKHLNQLIHTDLNIDCVISSLPLRSMPKDVVDEISRALEKKLSPQARLIQYTYGVNKEHYTFSENWRLETEEKIILNIPPARIEVYQYASSVSLCRESI